VLLVAAATNMAALMALTSHAREVRDQNCRKTTGVRHQSGLYGFVVHKLIMFTVHALSFHVLHSYVITCHQRPPALKGHYTFAEVLAM